jgi:hypothetical protein
LEREFDHTGKIGQTEHLIPDQSEHPIPEQTEQWIPEESEQSKIRYLPGY